MTIYYSGKNNDKNYREAIINYNNKEENKINKMYDILTEKYNYDCCCEQEVMSVIVCDKEEYNDLVKIYKQLKKII